MTVNPATTLRLDGRSALITGATRGIGRGIAEAFAAAGANVCVNARKPEELAETEAALRSYGVGVTTFQGSAGDATVADAAVERCVEQLGGCDIVVNNAATNPQFGPLIDAELAVVAKVWDVNIAGPLRFCQAAWRQWQR